MQREGIDWLVDWIGFELGLLGLNCFIASDLLFVI